MAFVHLYHNLSLHLLNWQFIKKFWLLIMCSLCAYIARLLGGGGPPPPPLEPFFKGLCGLYSLPSVSSCLSMFLLTQLNFYLHFCPVKHDQTSSGRKPLTWELNKRRHRDCQKHVKTSTTSWSLGRHETSIHTSHLAWGTEAAFNSNRYCGTTGWCRMGTFNN